MPGTTPLRFWDDLLAGRDLVTEVESCRWSKDAFLHPSKSHRGSAYTFAAGSVGDVSGFDAGFFSISPREASLMDPQQRLLLEMSWETFENAGIRPSTLRGSDCGVYIGIASADYSWRLADDLAAVDASFATGNTASIAANRISYAYDLRGPSMAVDTACSSSLIAFHQACRAIASGEISQALTGAISLHLHPLGFLSFSKASMLSRRGRCRVFDASADGYVRSEGGGVFLLKDYERALADGNPILAVVAHTVVNTDGHKSGLTVPSPAAQAALLTSAYTQAGIEPAQIDYIEAHGTGTFVGDPIETRALGEALGQRRPRALPLPIGSVKGNLGHLEAASGIAGLLKATHCLQHRIIPAHVGMDTPNPHIQFDHWNLEVVTANKPMRPTGRLVVGINSFGFGGANAHVILESHTSDAVRRPALSKTRPLPIMISARDPQALTAAARELGQFIARQPQHALYDIAYQSVHGRDRHPHCAVLFGSTPAAIATVLEQFSAAPAGQSSVEFGTPLPAPSGAAFIYTGNGAQWAGMGSRLLGDPTFKGAVREVDALFSRYADYSIEEELAGDNGESRYQLTEIAQPTLFALQVGITAMLRRQGLVPLAVAGHSVGEVAAAWASGALSLAAAVSVIHHRSALQGTTRGTGAMSAVSLAEPQARELLDEIGLADAVSIAGVNSRSGITVAAAADDLERMESVLARRKIAFKRLDLDYAFHSPAMDPLSTELRRALAHLEPEETTIPFHSTVTGGPVSGKVLDADYWWRNVRDPVLLELAVASMLRKGINIFVEVGPHPLLKRYLRECLDAAAMEGRVIATGVRGDDSAPRIYSAANQAIIAGAAVDWQRLMPWQGRPVRLPNYPWQREAHWHAVTPASLGLLARERAHPLLGHALAQAEWTWENSLDTQRYSWLADHRIGDATVFPGSAYAELLLAVAMRWQPGAFAEIADLEIHAPLLLAAEPARVVRSVLDAHDGRVAIKSHEYLKQEPWILHASGRILGEASGRKLERILGELPMRRADFTGASHHLLTTAAGLNYGPGFRAIEQGWVDADCALAVLVAPADTRPEHVEHHLDPALLDCTFQLIIQLLRDAAADYAGGILVPTRIGHMSFRAGAGVPRYARARLVRRGPRSVVAGFELFDDVRQPIAVLEEVRFRSMSVPREAGDQVRHLEYHAVPRPLDPKLTVAEVTCRERLDGTLGDCFRAASVERAQRLYALEVDPLLDALCSRFLAETLERQPALKLIGEPDAKAHPYRAHLIELAYADGLLESAESPGSAQQIWNSLLADYPDHAQIVQAVGCIGIHLEALLSGERTLEEIWPSQLSLPALLRQAGGAEFGVQLVAALRAEIGIALGTLPEGRRLGVVEVSDGSPVLAEALCAEFDFDRGDYHFVTTAPASLEAARRLKEKYPALDFAALDPGHRAEDSLATDRGTRHLAVVSLDFRTLREALRAIDYARAELAPGGTLILVGFAPARWLNFVQGADPDWWQGSVRGAPVVCVQPAEFWQEHLERAGWLRTHLHRSAERSETGAYVLIGTRPPAGAERQLALPLPRHWVLLADAQGYSARLASLLTQCLERRGDPVTVLAGCGAEALTAGLQKAHETHGVIHGVVCLSGLDGARAPAPLPELFGAQFSRCAHAAALTQSLERAEVRPALSFVTADATAHLLPGRADAAGRPSALADAPLSGLVRTLMNEASSGAVRLIDVETAGDLAVTAEALARELNAGDGEEEIMLTAAGERYAPRLRVVDPARGGADPAPRDPDTTSIRLRFGTPGQLKNLRWESYPRSSPQGTEVEVAVKATGLNFRDIMYTLGLLSDEALETGFAGPTLGLEFSGIVLSVGPDAKGFAPGDAVMGFAPASFGDRALTPTRALSRLPAGMSFEAAATIPSTFFTAYYALHHLARLEAGERVLIHGAAGGVGLAAIQIAQWRGAEIYATAGSEEKRDFLRLLGVERVFDSRSLAFADEILAETQGKGVDVVLNSLAGEAINRNFRVLKPFGRFLELGKRDFYENTHIGLRPFRNNISYFGVDADQLMQHRPDLTQRLFGELLALFREGVLHTLPYQTFDAAAVVDAFRHMQQSRQIGKIVVNYHRGIPLTPAAPRAVPSRLELEPDASFLVSGGLSGFGLRTAEWLADRGARHLVLIGRRGPGADESKTALARLERKGVRVLARSCDVTDRAALEALMAEIAATLPPLRGIVHAAMVIEDRLIRDMSAEQIRSVLAPKVLGAHHLHELTVELPLDFFVLYSSATTLFGNPGQGNYVAANAGLEALARARRAAGLPAVCIRWGAIDDVGFLARNQEIKQKLQSRMGGTALQSARALDELETLLVENRSDLGVLEFDWRALSRFLPSAGSPKFAELKRAGGDTEAAEEGTQDLKRMLAELSEPEFRSAIVDMLKVEIGEILRIPPAKIDATSSIQQMGLDSLMGVELVVAIESRFGMRLPMMALSESPTILKLAGCLVDQLRSEEGAGTEATRVQDTHAQIEKIASQHAVDLPAAELERIATSLRSAEAGTSRRMIH
jgi:acyl transferase domain-containing protein/NADPH:quinone reductase-like Zn-dependent oxidoreductase/NADP-dependent 3-hydroxy acid dehydrogenase YdfG/acyl carrier protein